jgi:hypothetical protein
MAFKRVHKNTDLTFWKIRGIMGCKAMGDAEIIAIRRKAGHGKGEEQYWT